MVRVFKVTLTRPMRVCVTITLSKDKGSIIREGERWRRVRWRKQSNIASPWNSVSSLVCRQDSQCVFPDHCSILLPQPKEVCFFFTLSHLAPDSLRHEQALRDKRAVKWSKEGSLPRIILRFTGVSRKKCS